MITNPFISIFPAPPRLHLCSISQTDCKKSFDIQIEGDRRQFSLPVLLCRDSDTTGRSGLERSRSHGIVCFASVATTSPVELGESEKQLLKWWAEMGMVGRTAVSSTQKCKLTKVAPPFPPKDRAWMDSGESSLTQVSWSLPSLSNSF